MKKTTETYTTFKLDSGWQIEIRHDNGKIKNIKAISADFGNTCYLPTQYQAASELCKAYLALFEGGAA